MNKNIHFLYGIFFISLTTNALHASGPAEEFFLYKKKLTPKEMKNSRKCAKLKKQRQMILLNKPQKANGQSSDKYSVLENLYFDQLSEIQNKIDNLKK